MSKFGYQRRQPTILEQEDKMPQDGNIPDISWDSVANIALQVVSEYLQSPEDKSQQVVKEANKLLSSYARVRQTESAKEALYFSMAREIAASPEQLEEYMRLTIPQSGFMKALPKGR